MVAHAEALRQPFDGLRDWPAQPAASPLRGGRTPLGSLDNIALTYVENKADVTWVPARPMRLGWPRMTDARGGLGHDLPLIEASGEPAGRVLRRLVVHLGV